MAGIAQAAAFRVALFCALAGVRSAASGAAEPETAAVDYAGLKAQAEAYYAQHSYALARDAYLLATNLAPSAPERRWTALRIADTRWRAQAGSKTANATAFEQAQRELDALVRDVSRVEDRDRVWAEAQESLGDFFWTRRDGRDWNAAWPRYAQALDWRAGQTNSAANRARYLEIVWKAADNGQDDPFYRYGWYGNALPTPILANAVKVAQDEPDRAHAHYLLAMQFMRGSDSSQRARAPDELEAAQAPGKSCPWYDDALFHEAEWLENNGRITLDDDGNWQQKPDYKGAATLYRRLLKDFAKGESRYVEEAREHLDKLVNPGLGVAVGSVFLPGSEVQFQLSSRNLPEVRFSLQHVALPEAVRFATGDNSLQEWTRHIPSGGEIVTNWSRATNGKGEHVPFNETVRLDAPLAPGAYLLEASSGTNRARDVIVVGDIALVTKCSGRQLVVYACDALSGVPVPKMALRLWMRYTQERQSRFESRDGVTDEDGLAKFDLSRNRDNRDNTFLILAQSGGRQAFTFAGSYWYSPTPDAWKLYAFTDRPAYRPGDEVKWKLIARQTTPEGGFLTPANQPLHYRIRDPRGQTMREADFTTSAFGSYAGSFTMASNQPLGEYTVEFWTGPGQAAHIGQAALFRMEEYKLPEFRVTVRTPEENGRRQTFRLGDTVSAEIQCELYAGGPVANATCEVLVRQRPFFRYWRRPHDFDWYYADMQPNFNRGFNEGAIVKRETLRTDAQGRAQIAFDTPRDGGQDLEYSFEARVTDASRREIAGAGIVRVTRQRYYANLEPDHQLYRPQDRVRMTVSAGDANEQPVQVAGVVKVQRSRWVEVWRSPEGREVTGTALRDARRACATFPPTPAPGKAGWAQLRCGYESEPVLERPLDLDSQGRAEFTFTPDREGYYRVSWRGKQKGEPSVSAESTVWVATESSADLGYRHGGLQIVADSDTFREGQSAPIMLSAPNGGGHVLFTVETDELLDVQVVKMDGDVKLLALPIRARHVPNVVLGAAMVADRALLKDELPIVVPPVRNFLKLTLAADKPLYLPRESGTLRVTARDSNDRPVTAEVALSLFDESVTYIQSEYAGDIRQFFYGDKRPHSVQTGSSFQQRPYLKLVREEGRLIDVREQRARTERQVNWGGPGNEGERSEIDSDGPIDGPLVMRGLYGNRRRDSGYKSAPALHGAAGGMVMDEMRAKKDSREGQSEQAWFRQSDKKDLAKGGESPAVVVRSDFRATALWQPAVLTDANGEAVVPIAFPDSLTAWRASARAVTSGQQFGNTNLTLQTKLPLVARLQTPRFLVAGDEVTVSAVFNNHTALPMKVLPELKAEGITLRGWLRGGELQREAPDAVEVPPDGEARVDWRAAAEITGEARLELRARAGSYSDGMSASCPVLEHGVETTITRSGRARGDDVRLRFDLPKARRPGSATLTVQVTPSLAVTMLDALPYLLDYPYGCVEQTMSRFLPAVIVRKTLTDLGLKPEAVADRIFGGIEAATVDKTHPQGAQNMQRLSDIVNGGLTRLYDFQHNDGAWAWWKEGDSDRFMTAYVVYGLALARQAGVEVKAGVAERGAAWLDKELVAEESNPDMQAWMLQALAEWQFAAGAREPSTFQNKALDNVWTQRDRLNGCTRALAALAAKRFGRADQARVYVDNLRNGIQVDDRPDQSIVQTGVPQSSTGQSYAVTATAHWGEDGIAWRWSDGGVEATANALRALLAVDPKHPLVAPTVQWLVKNRRGAQWSNTRDTALVVLALNDYLRVSGELGASEFYELRVNGQRVAEEQITPETVLSAPGRFEIAPGLLRDGANEVRIMRMDAAKGALYVSACAKFFSLEEPIPPAASELFLQRHYYRFVGHPSLLKGWVYERQPLTDQGVVTSGERIETVLTLEVKNNAEYLILEDLKPAGLEAVALRSGEALDARELTGDGAARTPDRREAGDYTGRTRRVYQELRDRKLAIFIDKLPQGIWELRCEMRAETPGRFHGLPALGQAMYVPEIRAHTAEQRITVEDRAEP